MSDKLIDARFGIQMMDGEELIFATQQDGLVRLSLITACLSIVGIIAAPLVWLGAVIAKDKFRYWLTNRRVILSSGFIGYKIRSIPLERISDVGLSRTLPEILSGVSSVVVRDMTGEAQTGKSLLAINFANASEFQRLILEEVQKVNQPGARRAA